MMKKVRSGWAFILGLVVLVTLVIVNWGPAAQAATQAQIVAAMGVGWNLGNQLESNDGKGTPSETAWNNGPITQALITTVKARLRSLSYEIESPQVSSPVPEETETVSGFLRVVSNSTRRSPCRI